MTKRELMVDGLAPPISHYCDAVRFGDLLFISGVPPTDAKGAPETATGATHNNLFLILFLALTIAQLCSAFALRGQAGWRGYARYSALTPLIAFVLLILYVGFGSDPGDPLFAIAGLIQRLLIAVSFGWMTVIGRRILAN